MVNTLVFQRADFT